MFRKVLVIVTVTAISVFCLSSCKKRSSEAEPDEEVLKTVAEYDSEAKKQINKENMADELERIEKALDQELSQSR